MVRVVAVDARMALNSGIGVYLRHTLPYVAAARPDWIFRLYGSPSDIESFSAIKNLESRPLKAGIYSVREQFEFPSALGRDVAAVWVPHYNIPVFSSKPVFVTVHDVAHLAEPTARGGPHRRAYATTLLQAVRRKAAGIFFVSQFSREEFVRLVGRPSCPDHITYNAPSPIWRNAQMQAARPIERRYLIYVGAIKPHKNLAGLVTAFRAVTRQFDVDLVIVGRKGGYLNGDETIDKVSRDLQERIRFTGSVSDPELVQWVAHAEALVFPSFYEGFGIPPLEAMSVRCPTVVSDISPLREVCGDASEYVNPHDPQDIARGITKVLSDPTYADHLRSAGEVRAGRFDFAKAGATIAEAMGAHLGR